VKFPIGGIEPKAKFALDLLQGKCVVQEAAPRKLNAFPVNNILCGSLGRAEIECVWLRSIGIDGGPTWVARLLFKRPLATARWIGNPSGLIGGCCSGIFKQRGVNAPCLVIIKYDFKRGRMPGVFVTEGVRDELIPVDYFARRQFNCGWCNPRAIGDDQSIITNLHGFAGSVGADIGLFRRVYSRTYNSYSQEGISRNGYPGESGPAKVLAVVFIALALGGFIACAKGIYSENYFLIIGGWMVSAIAIAVGTIWIIVGHFPFFP